MVFKRILASLCVVAFCVSLMVGCTPAKTDAPAEAPTADGTTGE